MRRERTLVWGLVCLFAAVNTAPAADEPEAHRPLNVLMIAVDDLRPDLGCYGNGVAKTPNIDRLAARGVVFGHAYCQQAVCSPSRTSLMTGQRPDATRVFDLKTHFRTALPDCVTLPQYFKANGYHCTALSKIYHRGYEDGRSWSEPHWYPNGKTIDTDPDDWTRQTATKLGGGVEEYSADTPRAESGKGPATVVSEKADDALPDGSTAAEAVQRIAMLSKKDKPFFLAVGLLKPHLPFVAPKKYWDLYDAAAIPTFRPARRHSPGTPTASSTSTSTSRRATRFRRTWPAGSGTATTPASATPTPRSVACSMPSTRPASPTARSSCSGAITAGSSATTASGTSTPTSNSPPGHR
jgi:arylsulfatase A-like enzyme